MKNMTDKEELLEEKQQNFSWIPFYEELADKLCEYHYKQAELLNFVNLHLSEFTTYFVGQNLQYLDPFTFLGIFNRYTTKDKRIKICEIIKENLGIISHVPSDFDGIPILNNKKSIFSLSKTKTDADNLWELFVEALKFAKNEPNKFEEFYNISLLIKGTKWNLSMGLYWIRPNFFINLDSTNKKYLKSRYNLEIKNGVKHSASDYCELLLQVKDKMNVETIKERTFSELSHNANLYAQKGDTNMSNKTKVKDYISILEKNHNLIFHGAPGTGKTYMAKQIASQMIFDKVINEKDMTQEEKTQWENQFGFVQFHPSYDYTDFVEGLRPCKNNDGQNVGGFERRDGVFKAFCNKAIKEIKFDNFDETWNKLLDRIEQDDFIDIPLIRKTGTFRLELTTDDSGVAIRKYENGIYKKGEWILGKSIFFNKEQIYNVYRGLNGVPSGVYDNYRKAIVVYMKDELGLKDYNNATIWKVSLEGSGKNPTRTDCPENGYIRIGWAKYGNADFEKDKFEDLTDEAKRILVRFQKEMKKGDIVVSCYNSEEKDAIGIVEGDYEYREGSHFPRYRKVKWLVKNINENILKQNKDRKMTQATVYKLNMTVGDIQGIINKHSKKHFIFIIDEINRGETSKIFGELFFSIDPSYRGIKGKIKTQYQNLVPESDIFGDGFYVPENVYIIGTMNDIDRNVETMDFAFRRRFAWKEIEASETQEMLDSLENKGVSRETTAEAKAKMNALNTEIANNQDLGKSYQIGAAYFMKIKEYNGDFEQLWKYHLEGLLVEYLRGTGDEENKLNKFKDVYYKSKNTKKDVDTQNNTDTKE